MAVCYSRSILTLVLATALLALSGCCSSTKTDKPVTSTPGQTVTATYDATPKVTRTTSITEQVEHDEPPPPVHVTTVRTFTKSEQFDGHGHRVAAEPLHQVNPTVSLGTRKEQKCIEQDPVLVDPATGQTGTDPVYVPDFQPGKAKPK